MTTTLDNKVHYIAQFTPKFEELMNGNFAVRNVPIFEIHEDRGWDCSPEWMRDTVDQQFNDKRERQFLPRLIEGHTSEEEDKPARGSLDNFRFDEKEGILYADILDISIELKERLEAGEFPGRSVEVYPEQNRISALALLGGHKPAFQLPDMKFNNKDNEQEQSQKEKAMFYTFQYSDTPITEDDTDQKSKARETPQIAENEDTTDKSALRELIVEVVNNMQTQKEENMSKDEKTIDPKDEVVVEEEATIVEKESEVSVPEHAEVSSQDYADQQVKIEGLEAANLAQSAELLELRYTAQKIEWNQKYQDLRVPTNILNVEDHVEAIMKLPQEHRESYFDGTSKLAKGPSIVSTKIETEGVTDTGIIDQGDIEKYYEDNKAKYRGDYARACKDYKDEQKLKGNPQYTNKHNG